jgi:hypothetical protein
MVNEFIKDYDTINKVNFEDLFKNYRMGFIIWNTLIGNEYKKILLLEDEEKKKELLDKITPIKNKIDKILSELKHSYNA